MPSSEMQRISHRTATSHAGLRTGNSSDQECNREGVEWLAVTGSTRTQGWQRIKQAVRGQSVRASDIAVVSP
jgi:hypothetical protein